MAVAVVVLLSVAAKAPSAIAQPARDTKGFYPDEWSLLDWRDHRSGFQVTTFPFAGNRVTIPKLPLQRFSGGPLSDPSRRDTETIYLKLRLPDLKPFHWGSKENLRQDLKEYFTLQLDAAPRPNVVPIEELIRRHSIGKTPPLSVPDGKIRTEPRTTYDDWAYAYSPVDGYRLFALCGKNNPNNRCQASFLVLQGKALVTYAFTRDTYFERWEEIDGNIRRLVASFVNPSALSP